MDHEIRLQESQMSSTAAWQAILTSLGVTAADFGDIRSVQLTVSQIFLEPS